MKKIFKGYVKNVSEEELSKDFNECLNLLKEKDLLVKNFSISSSLLERLNLDKGKCNFEFKEANTLKELFDLIVCNLGAIVKEGEHFVFAVSKYTNPDSKSEKEEGIEVDFKICKNNHSQNYFNCEFINKDLYNSVMNEINNSDLPTEIKNSLIENLDTTFNFDYNLKSLIKDLEEFVLVVINNAIEDLNSGSDFTYMDKTLKEMNFGDKILNSFENWNSWCKQMSKFLSFEYNEKPNSRNNEMKIYFNGKELKSVNQIFYTKCKLV